MMIEVERLSKSFKVHVRNPGFIPSLKSLFHRQYTIVKAVDSISFSIPEGEIVGFLGPNGAGKTTTLKMLSGLLHPTSGRVQVAGFIPFEQKNAFKRQISLVMGQKSQLIWDVPPTETFLINKAIYEIEDRDYRSRLHELVSMLDLEKVLNKPVRQLSLGERMKCELVAALLHRPRVVFLDEPTIGLDVQMQQAVRQFVRMYNREYRATILLTSHYMADVTVLCERVMVINRGRLIYDGDITRLVERFAPFKRIRMQFAEKIEQGKVLSLLGNNHRLEEMREMEAVIDVPREDVTSLSALLLTHLPVVDLTVEDPPMESVIGRVFEVG